MRLLIISHTPHYQCGQEVRGWGPTVREIDALSSLFTEITHLAILHPDNPAPDSSLPYRSPNVTLRLLPPAGGPGLRDKVGILTLYPHYLKAMISELEKADFVHVRCPANISLLGLLVLAVKRTPRYRWVKYAGNWRPASKESWSYTFQRLLLDNNFHRGVVTVNGHWFEDRGHVYPFLNPSFSDHKVAEMSKFIINKELRQPVRILFVGRLESTKGIEVVLRVASELRKRDIQFELNLVGDGPQMAEFQAMTGHLDLQAYVNFRGWLHPDEISLYYQRSHFLLLPTKSSEGWPKVLSEGMACGAVPLASAISSIPQNLNDFGCGRALPLHDVNSYVDAIESYLAAPASWLAESRAGMAAARHFTYEAYLQQIRQMASKAWGLTFPANQKDDER
jgi:glycosyltransferase involved in cell wall biosynthesis